MLKNLLNWLNEQHWYIVALLVIIGLFFWAYGCESKVQSLITPNKMVNRMELTAEIEYTAAIAKVRVANLDKQDEIKKALTDALVAIGSGGQINAAGLVNIAATVLAIGWGLNRNQKLKDALKTSATTTT